MRWQDVDGAWWTIPAELAKNGLSHRVPLSPQALTILERLRTRAKGPWLFPSRLAGSGRPGGESGPYATLVRVEATRRTLTPRRASMSIRASALNSSTRRLESERAGPSSGTRLRARPAGARRPRGWLVLLRTRTGRTQAGLALDLQRALGLARVAGE